MNERPILFSGPMVRAILAGEKTQTRRICKQAAFVPGIEWAAAVYPARESGWIAWGPHDSDGLAEFTKRQYQHGFHCPYGQPGDRLWVRETHALVPVTAYRASTEVQQTVNPAEPDAAAIYRAGWDRSDPGTRWRPSIHMPRWASRITIELTGVRVERVQDISAADKAAEGLHEADGYGPAAFADLWDQINAKRGYGWAVNPWVWVLTFRRVPSDPAS